MNYSNNDSQLVNSIAKPPERSRIDYNESGAENTSTRPRRKRRAIKTCQAHGMVWMPGRYEIDVETFHELDKELIERLRSQVPMLNLGFGPVINPDYIPPSERELKPSRENYDKEPKL